MPVVIPSVAEAPTMPVWPDAGRILGYRSKPPAYRAAKSGAIPTIQLSERRVAVPTAALRQLLGLPIDGPRIELSAGDAR